MKYALLIGISVIAARALRARWRRLRGSESVKAPKPARSSMSLALIVTLFVVAWPLTEGIQRAGAEPPQFRAALVWAGFGLVAPLVALYAYRRAKAAGVPASVVRQSTLTSYSFAGLAVGAFLVAVWISRLVN